MRWYQGLSTNWLSNTYLAYNFAIRSLQMAIPMQWPLPRKGIIRIFTSPHYPSQKRSVSHKNPLPPLSPFSPLAASPVSNCFHPFLSGEISGSVVCFRRKRKKKEIWKRRKEEAQNPKHGCLDPLLFHIQTKKYIFSKKSLRACSHLQRHMYIWTCMCRVE